MKNLVHFRGQRFRVVWSLKEWRKQEQTISEAILAEKVHGRKVAVERETDRYWWNHKRRA
jgi:hypothetical protein